MLTWAKRAGARSGRLFLTSTHNLPTVPDGSSYEEGGRLYALHVESIFVHVHRLILMRGSFDRSQWIKAGQCAWRGRRSR